MDNEMRPLLIIFSLFAIITTAHAQPLWESENGPYGGTYISIIAHGDSIVAAPYYRPFLLIGDANGNNWRQVDMPSPAAEPFSLLSPGGGRLLAGSFGRIYRSDDNGATWNERYLPDLQGEIVDELTGEGDTLFACGGGLLYRSADRGFSWQLQESAPEVLTVKVFKHLVIVGGPAGIHLSSDHGSSWNHSPLAADTVEALFTTSKHLFAALRSPLSTDTQQQLLYRSTNGMQWEGGELTYTASSIVEVGDTLFAALRNSAESFTLFLSPDNGLSWSGLHPAAYEQLPRDIWTLFPVDNALLVSMGGIGLWKYRTEDKSWIFYSKGFFPVGIAKLGFDDRHMYAYSMKENFTTMRSHDSDDWTRMPYFSYGERPGDMHVAPGLVYLGLSGSVMHSTNWGREWWNDYIPYPDSRVQAFTSMEIQHGARFRIIAGIENHKTVFSDFESGFWETVEDDGPAQWFGFASHGSDVWAATTDGLLRSVDTGRTWTAFGPPGSCYAVAAWDGNTVITASETGVHALDTRSSVSTALWTVSAGYSLHVLPDGGGICAATQDSGIVLFRTPSAAPVVLREGLPAVGFAPPTVCRIALDSHDGRLYFGNCGLPGLWSLDLSAIPVSVSETSAIPEQMMLSSVYPNPASGAATVNLDMAGEEFVEITLVDRLGRTMRIVHAGELGPGQHTLSIDVQGLLSGLYFCVARTGGRVSTVPVSVLH